MKAIRDYPFDVKLHKPDKKVNLNYWWWGVVMHFPVQLTILSDRKCHSLSTVKKSWEKFAKLNGIKKWRYV